MVVDCQMSTAHEAAARMRSKPKISLRSRGNGEALAVVMEGLLLCQREPGDIALEPCVEGDIICVESAQTLRVGPVDRRVVSILASIIPAHAVVRPGALFVSNCHGDAGGKGMCIFRPDLFVRIHAWNRVDRHLHEAGNLDRTVLALFLEGDRHQFHPKDRGDERRKSSYRTTHRPCEDGLQGLTLLLICSLIKVESHRPVAFSHSSRCACDQSNIQAIKGYAAIVPPINVETEGDLTRTCGRLRS